MSGGDSRQTPLPKGQFRDRAESERQRKTHSPRMVTYVLNRPLHAHTMHIFSHQDCIPFHTRLSGGYLSHGMIFITRHNTGSALAFPNSSYSRVFSFTYDASNTLSHRSNGNGGAYWMTSLKQAGETRIYMGGQHAQGPHKIIQLATLLPNGWRAVNAFAKRSQWASHPSNGTGGTAHWICTGMVRQEIKPTEQDSTPLSLAALKQLGESHMGGHRQDPHKIIKLAPLLPNRNGRVVNWIAVQSTQARLRSSHGTNAHNTLLCQLRQEPKRGPAFVLVTVYRHVVMYVGLTQKGHNGTAVLTDIASQAIKPRGLSPMSPSIVTVNTHLGTVSFIRSVSKIGWDPQQVILTFGNSKLMQVAPGEPFLPFPREGVG